MLKYQSVVVPLDTSQFAELALAKAVAVAKRNSAHLDLLSVIDTHQTNYYGGLANGDIVNKLVQDATEYLAELADQIKTNDGLTDISTHIRFGNPKTVISLEFVKDHHNDLVMMGATGMNTLERMMTGSVTDFVTRNAKCDVLVVRTNLENVPGGKIESPFRTSMNAE
ncbi:UspA domain-containing protein [Secundilactobacillus odoratitofui DSM 19909 = JCM 15043]|uniref:UspA domain-containing protein n=1 Tax=Secundilactobacillus odoratitofui DSM 19909 = JCM 15043 TaxID=1423776 RepID=A0A0R1LSN8_9LACO|nr:universal stress protein [Secundilactobacillus odoratitofui]KRK98766.1 UspA domain-containing protein [Secundilactobacillus odoratitofui DSM 19909 = JCM 15043]